MTYFTHKKQILHCEEVSLLSIAEQYGTPCYVYSRAALENNIQAYLTELAGTKIKIRYAVKANSNLAILDLIARHNIGFDIVSVGELERVLKINGDPQKIIFSGVGKRNDEIQRAMDVGVGCFDVESEEELQRINQIAKDKNKIIHLALRINPNIDGGTHKHISTGLYENKFGINIEDIMGLCDQIIKMPNIQLTGLAFHLGSQLTNLQPILAAIDSIVNLSNQIIKRGMPLKYLNFGGGLGVCYENESPPSVKEYIAAIVAKTADLPFEIILEPGRSLIANTGILLTKIEYLKHTAHKNFAIVDAAMNDLIRPALYEAWHDIKVVNENKNVINKLYDVVGPVCETADYFGKNRNLTISQDSVLAIMTAGAYGFCMSSNYNSRLRPAEVMVDRDKMYLIRERESMSDLYRLEHEIIK